MATKLVGYKALVAGSLKKILFCGFPKCVSAGVTCLTGASGAGCAPTVAVDLSLQEYAAF